MWERETLHTSNEVRKMKAINHEPMTSPEEISVLHDKKEVRKGSSQRSKFFNNREKVLGQFFTPYELTEFIVNFALKHVDNVKSAIDPACGDGAFLLTLLKKGINEVWGVDIDRKIINYLPQFVKEKAKIVIGDSLIRYSILPTIIPENYFDLAVGNPPFSAKYGRIKDYRLKMYEISAGKESEAIENIFIERFIRLVRPNGVVGIIIPDGVLLNKSNVHVRKYILRFRILAVISLPRGIFRSITGTTSKTCVLFIKKEPNNGQKAFFYELKDSEDSFESILKTYENKQGFWEIPQIDNMHPIQCKKIELNLTSKYPLKPLGELIVGMKSGRTEYGINRKFVNQGIRYISAKVVMPYGLDFHRDERFVEPESLMDKKTAHVKPEDVLFVRVGVGSAGKTAVAIDEYDSGIADDWIYIIRTNDQKILPYYLAIYLQTEEGKKQLELMKRGVGTVTIPQSELKKLMVPIIPIEEQRIIKQKYIEMVKSNRIGDKDKAIQIFNESIKHVTNLIKNNH